MADCSDGDDDGGEEGGGRKPTDNDDGMIRYKIVKHISDVGCMNYYVAISITIVIIYVLFLFYVNM